jgi:hypothetical protein
VRHRPSHRDTDVQCRKTSVDDSSVREQEETVDVWPEGARLRGRVARTLKRSASLRCHACARTAASPSTSRAPARNSARSLPPADTGTVPSSPTAALRSPNETQTSTRRVGSLTRTNRRGVWGGGPSRRAGMGRLRHRRPPRWPSWDEQMATPDRRRGRSREQGSRGMSTRSPADAARLRSTRTGFAHPTPGEEYGSPTCVGFRRRRRAQRQRGGGQAGVTTTDADERVARSWKTASTLFPSGSST